jgi:magnesium chelatase family protein
MLADIHSAAVIGREAHEVTVHVDCRLGPPEWTIAGLPFGASRASRDRVGCALLNSGFAVPPKRIAVTLTPNDIARDATSFDAPIALGLLVATEQLATEALTGIVAVGELGVDGMLLPIAGASTVARLISRYRRMTLVLPRRNEASVRRESAVPLLARASLVALVRALARRHVPRENLAP